MEQTKPAEQRQVHWRVPADTLLALKAFADRTHRSMNGAAVHLLETGLKADEVER